MPAAKNADMVPVETIQQALDDAGISRSELARRMGWVSPRPDTIKVRRALGLHPSGSRQAIQKHVTYERALELIEAMGLEPVDYGL